MTPLGSTCAQPVRNLGIFLYFVTNNLYIHRYSPKPSIFIHKLPLRFEPLPSSTC